LVQAVAAVQSAPPTKVETGAGRILMGTTHGVVVVVVRGLVLTQTVVPVVLAVAAAGYVA